MPNLPEKDGKSQVLVRNRKILPRLSILILVFLALAGVSVLAFQPVARALRNEMAKIEEKFIARAEAAIGRKITYAAIRPNISSFDISQVQIFDEDARQLLSVGRLRISFSLIDLLRRDYNAIRSLLIDKPSVTLDLRKDSDIIELFSKKSGEENDTSNLADALSSFLPNHALLKIRGGQCTVLDGNAKYSLSGVYANIHTEKQALSLDGRCSGDVSLGGASLAARFNMRITGDYSTDSREGAAHLVIPFIAADSFRLRSTAFDLNLHEGGFAISKSHDSLPFDLSLQYNFDEKNFSAAYSCSELLLGDLITLERKGKEAAPVLSLKSSGSAMFEKKADASLEYHIDLAGTSPAARGGAFTVKAEGSGEYAKIDRLYVLLPTVPPSAAGNTSHLSGEIDFSGNIGFTQFTSNGFLSLKDFSLSGKGNINTGLSIASGENRITIYGEEFDIADIGVGSLAVVLEHGQDGIGFAASFGNFHQVDYPDRFSSGSIALNGLVDTERRKIKAHLNLDLLPVYDLENMLRPFNAALSFPPFSRELLQRTFITTTVLLETDFKSFSYDAPRFVVSSESLQENSGDITLEEHSAGVHNPVCLLSIAGTDKRFDLREGRFIHDGETFLLHGFSDYSNPLNVNFSVMANYADISYYLEGVVLNRRSISIQGSHGISVYLDSDARGTYSGYIQGQDIPVLNRDQIGTLSFFTSMRYASSGAWALDIDNIILNDFAGPAGKINLQIMGNADQNGANLSRFFYSDDKGPLNGWAEFTWINARNAVFGGNLTIEGVSETFHVEAEYAASKLSVDISGKGMQLGRFSDKVYNAVADADFTLQWNPEDSFVAELNVNLLKAAVEEKEFSAVMQAVLNREEFAVHDLRFMYAGIEGVVPLCTLNIAEGVLEGVAEIRGDAAGRDIDGNFSISAHFGDMESWLRPGNALNNFYGEVAVKNMRYASFDESGPFSIIFSHTRGETSISGGPKNMLRINADREGNFYGALSAPSPVRGSVTGTIEQGIIEARCGDLYVDLKGLWEFVPPLNNFALAGGYVNAQVEISGPISDPDFFGTIKSHSLNMRVPHYIPRDIRPIPFTARMNGKEIILDPVPTSVGTGAGTIGCWFLFERWIPSTFRIDISVPPQSPIPFDFDITGFLAQGDVSGNLTLSQENMVFDIRGDLYANNAQMGVNSDEIVRVRGQNLASSSRVSVITAINVITGPTVEFIGPNINYPIIRANPDIGTRVEITSDSFARQFSINSDVKIRSGEIFYFERRFYIRSGTLVFRENDLRFDPRLTVRAEMRDRTDEGPVTISMIVDNAPLLSFTARFESVPSLAQAEIFSLLGQSITGIRSDEETADYQRALINSGVDILAQFMGARQFEREIRKFMRMDMFSFKTQFFQNLVILPGGAAGGASNEMVGDGGEQPPVDRIIGVGNYFDNTTVFLGKYIGADIFAQSMLALRYDNNKVSYGGLGFEWDIGVEMQTPLFDIRWDLSPTNSENWWVSNSSITLTIRRAF